MNKQRHFLRFIASAASLLLSALSGGAETGLGFGWNEAQTQELVYRVDFATGSASATGVIDGLRFVATGSHAVDPKTGTSLMIGMKEGSETNYLFLVFPAEKRNFSFQLPAGNGGRVVYQQLFIHPASGDMFLLSYNSSEAVNQIHKVSLNLVAGTLSLSKVGNVTGLEAFSVGTPKITSSGEILIPAVSVGGAGGGDKSPAGESASLVSFDTANGNVNSLPLQNSLSDFAVCETVDGRSLLATTTVRDEMGISSLLLELDSSGAVLSESPLEGISSTLAGSAFCYGGAFGIIGEDSSSMRKLYRYSLENRNWESAPLGEGHLKYIAGVERDFQAARSLGIQAVSRFANVKAADIKACAANFKRHFKRGSSSKIRSAKATLGKFQFSRKGSKYLCALKKKK